MMFAPAPGETDDNFASAARKASMPRSAMHTFMPSAAKRIAAASPMPEAPPVMTATLSLAIAGWGIASSPRHIGVRTERSRQRPPGIGRQ
jgi:hypothetical protein